MDRIKQNLGIILRLLYRMTRRIIQDIEMKTGYLITLLKLYGNNVKFGEKFHSNGYPLINVWPGGKFEIGNNVRINNGGNYNNIGRQQKCSFVVAKNAELLIGNDVGISATAIICHKKIKIGNNVKLGGNTVLYDTDFHSLDASLRLNKDLDKINALSKPITICDNVFIGAHSTILKGVTIGENSIIGACSVITGNVPENEIWAGNPARLLRKISQQDD